MEILRTLASLIRNAVQEEPTYWATKIQDTFGIACAPKEPGTPLDPIVLRQTYSILDLMRPNLVKACGVNTLYFSNSMGPNKSYYPNHGYYVDNSVTLNNDIFYHPDVMDDFFDSHGYFIGRPTQTIVHEFAHGYDAAHDELSVKPEWTKLSGWSAEDRPGLKRLVIMTPGQPPLLGEWYFDPKAKFTRFYAKRNPWDDFADSFAYFAGGLKDKVPANKAEYMSNLLKPYLN